MEHEDSRQFWQEFLPTAFAEGRRFSPGLNRALKPEGLDAEAVRSWLARMISTFEITATEWARHASLAPSTLNRFLKSDTPANLSANTISALAHVMQTLIDQDRIRVRSAVGYEPLPAARQVWTVPIIGELLDRASKAGFEWQNEFEYEVKVPLPKDFINYSFGIEVGSTRYFQYPLRSILICDPAQRNLNDIRVGQKFLLHRRTGNAVVSSLGRVSLDPEGQRWLTKLPGDAETKAFYLEDILPLGYSHDALISFLVVSSVTTEDWMLAGLQS